MSSFSLKRFKALLEKSGLYLTNEQVESLYSQLKLEMTNNNSASETAQINRLKQELSNLRAQNNDYKNKLRNKFADKNNQTIAYQVGTKFISFFKNPIKNPIKPSDVTELYVEALKRNKKKRALNKMEKVFLALFEDDVINGKIEPSSNLKLYQNQQAKTIQDISSVSKSTETLSFTPNMPKKLYLPEKRAKELKVAIILDEFSFNSFKDEFMPLIITPQNWKEVFTLHQPDLFFCESAWSGTDSKTRPWKGKVYASKNFPKENRNELLEILDYCDKHGIPTVFWNKEDPTHYPDRVHDFVATAKLFDYVFTTAEECVERYKNDYGLEHVYVLPFATQPKLFNPITSPNLKRENSIVFAGSWYANHVERSKVMEQIFDSIILSDYELSFYNRYYGDDDANHLIPKKYKKFEKPNVPNAEVYEVYKSSIFGLNINTVTDSNTMFARRVFELMSSNTLVLSNYSVGMEKMFGDNVIFLDKNPNALQTLSTQQISKIRRDSLNDVLKNHTYNQRFEHILQTMGFVYKQPYYQLTLVLPVSNAQEIENQKKIFMQKFSEQYKVLFILDEKISDIDIAEYYTNFTFQNISVLSKSYIENYGLEKQYFIETDFFFLTNDLINISLPVISEALLHTSYIDDDYIDISGDLEEQYTFKQEFHLNNVLAPRQKFIEAITYFDKDVSLSIYKLSIRGN